jgi:hypothetical protein
VHDLSVGHGAHAQLREEALVVEQSVLEQDFFGYLFGTADGQRAPG